MIGIATNTLDRLEAIQHVIGIVVNEHNASLIINCAVGGEKNDRIFLANVYYLDVPLVVFKSDLAYLLIR